MAEIVSLADAVAAGVHDGDAVAMEGFTHLIPFAAGHEVIRQRRRDLTLIRMTPDVIYDQLIGAGCASKLIFSWGGNPGSARCTGSATRSRTAGRARWRWRSTATPGMANRYVAGASGLPVRGPARLRGTGLERLRRRRPPVDQADHLPVHRRDADRGGRPAARRGGHPRPAGRPERATSSCGASPACRRRPCSRARGRWSRSRRSSTSSTPAAGRDRAAGLGGDYVAEVPGGAHPSYAHGYSDRDNDYYVAWDAISRDRDSFDRLAGRNG